MTSAQQHASNPAGSRWVSANAGTGKTRVLVDRVLRLILHGASPEKIVCITFTKAAANEMQTRIFQKISGWMSLPEKTLKEELSSLCGEAVTDEQCRLARRLFLQLVDGTHRLRIQTIHSLCQTILQTFPLEAGLSAGFSLIDERSEQALLQESRQRLLRLGERSADKALAEALQQIASYYSEYSVDEIIADILHYREDILRILRQPDGLTRARSAIYASLAVDENEADEVLLSRYFDQTDEALLREAIPLLEQGTQTNQRIAEALAKWCQLPTRSMADFHVYQSVFLTKDAHQPKKQFISKAFQEAYPALADRLFEEQQRVYHCHRQWVALKTVQLSVALLNVAESLLLMYDFLKRTHKLLDYHDLLFTTRDLLLQPGIAEWVLYKMDHRIEHLLIDEAQDTSPVQWEIVRALTSEFFAPDQQSDHSLMVVGDVKQSIYSFQGAKPKAYVAAEEHFADHIRHSGHHDFATVALETSFRSTTPVLALVDAVFESEALREKLTFSDKRIAHTVHRTKDAGRVECWPLVEVEKRDIPPVWDVSEPDYALKDNTALLANQIADTIQQWLSEERLLPSKGRPVLPGDIMILVRRRNLFMQALAKALRDREILIEGMDRLSLNDHLAVKDLLALAQFTLLPEDDLNLACLLKSPLLGLSEEALQTVAYGRGELSLWQALLNHANDFQTEITRLQTWKAMASEMTPFAFFLQVLEVQEMRRVSAACFTPEVQEIYDEFLLQCQLFEQSHHPTMQRFVAWFSESHTDIKRETGTQVNAVRIMTIHGAKGLQAPIVFLPDTTQPPQHKATLWRRESGEFPLLYLGLPSHALPEALEDVKQRDIHDMEAEYWRLLYVAMTRAEDELYICGWQPGKSSSRMCWYEAVKEAMQLLHAKEKDGCLYIVSEQMCDVKKATDIIPPKENMNIPEWYTQPLEQEKILSERLFNPSMGVKRDELFSQEENDAIRRGNAIHYLLETYAGHTPSAAELEKALQQQETVVSSSERRAWAQEAWQVLNDLSFAYLFGENSMAEQPVSGVVNGRAISGIIDRLVVEEEHILIVDYKTDRHPPETQDSIPQNYLIQLALYRELISDIYYCRTIDCAILWTSVLRLDMLEESLLLKSLHQHLDSNAA